ncbi:MAG: divalent-cation tolerance protein CutA [Nitrospirae bacterium]|nr:divalent-cation tolerance protein CutA [Nitrospirota bacterium]
MEFIVVLITAGSMDEGEKIANFLVENHLAACVNVVPSVESFFFWEGKSDRQSEVLLVAKSRKALLDNIIGYVKEIHSYSVPEIIAIPVIGGSDNYLKWVRETTL